ncbi:hypothetical protein BDK51DRAFT_29415, partial [Blyttiomyces helicus]
MAPQRNSMRITREVLDHHRLRIAPPSPSPSLASPTRSPSTSARHDLSLLGFDEDPFSIGWDDPVIDGMGVEADARLFPLPQDDACNVDALLEYDWALLLTPPTDPCNVGALFANKCALAVGATAPEIALPMPAITDFDLFNLPCFPDSMYADPLAPTIDDLPLSIGRALVPETTIQLPVVDALWTLPDLEETVKAHDTVSPQVTEDAMMAMMMMSLPGSPLPSSQAPSPTISPSPSPLITPAAASPESPHPSSPTLLHLDSFVEPARGARRFAAEAAFGCRTCSGPVATLVVHGDRAAVQGSYVADVACLRCSGAPEAIPIRKRGRRPVASDSLECDCCKKRIGHGHVRPVTAGADGGAAVVRGAHLSTMYDVICTVCKPRYSLCTQCGGGGG